MVVVEKIQMQTALLPESLQTEVLHFVEYLLYRSRAESEQDNLLDGQKWSRTSLAMAMRGMEDDDEPEYSLDDLKGTF